MAYHLHTKHDKHILKDCTRCGIKHEFYNKKGNVVYEFRPCKGRMGRPLGTGKKRGPYQKKNRFTKQPRKQVHVKWARLDHHEKYKVAKLAERCKTVDELVVLAKGSGFQIPREQLNYAFKNHAQTINHVEKIEAEKQKVHEIMQKVADEYPNGATTTEALTIIHAFSPKTAHCTAKKWLQDRKLYKRKNS